MTGQLRPRGRDADGVRPVRLAGQLAVPRRETSRTPASGASGWTIVVRACNSVSGLSRAAHPGQQFRWRLCAIAAGTKPPRVGQTGDPAAASRARSSSPARADSSAAATAVRRMNGALWTQARRGADQVHASLKRLLHPPRRRARAR